MENSDIGFIIYMSILSLLGIVLNLPIIIVYRKKYTHSASLYLLFALALLNFLISLIVVPITLITTIEVFYINNRFYCGMSYFLRFFSNSISVILLGLIAYERYNIISAKTITKLRIMEKREEKKRKGKESCIGRMRHLVPTAAGRCRPPTFPP